MANFAIIGGGIVGASIAYHLSRRTTDPITLFERGEIAGETTQKSVAQFGFYGDVTQNEMKRYGMRMYNRFFADSIDDPRYTMTGLLEVAVTDEDAETLEETVSMGGDPRAGKIAGTSIDSDLVEYIHGPDMSETIMLPQVETRSIRGAIYRPKTGFMNTPARLAREFIRRAEKHGVEVRTGTAVTDIEMDENSVTGVRTEAGTLAADSVICAAGPWNPTIAESVGLELPIRHTLAPVCRFVPDPPFPCTFPTISLHDRPYALYCRSRTECLVGYHPRGTFDDYERITPETVPESVPSGIRAEMLSVIERFIPSLAAGDPRGEWVGIRSHTPDGNPIVGWTDVEGFSIAAFNTSGIQLAPAVGRMIADQLVAGEPTEWYDSLSITRFDGHSDTVP